MRCGQSKSFGDGRGDRPTAAMLINRGRALWTQQCPGRAPRDFSFQQVLEVGFYVCLRTKQAGLLRQH